MHTYKSRLHPQARRKKDCNRSRTTLTISPETKALLQEIGIGSMSDGAYFSSQIVSELLRQEIISIEADQGGTICRLDSGQILAAIPRSLRVKLQNFGMNPYAGRVLSKKQLVNTGRFTYRQLRAILPGQRVTDRFGFWWQRIDTPNRPGRDQTGLRNSRGRLINSYLGLGCDSDRHRHNEADNLSSQSWLDQPIFVKGRCIQAISRNRS